MARPQNRLLCKDEVGCFPCGRLNIIFTLGECLSQAVSFLITVSVPQGAIAALLRESWKSFSVCFREPFFLVEDVFLALILSCVWS